MNEVWEINLNPAYYAKPKRTLGEIDNIYTFSHKLMKDEYLKLDSNKSTKIDIEISQGLGKMFKPNIFKELARSFHDNFNTRIKFFQWIVKILFGISNLLASFIVLLIDVIHLQNKSD